MHYFLTAVRLCNTRVLLYEEQGHPHKLIATGNHAQFVRVPLFFNNTLVLHGRIPIHSLTPAIPLTLLLLLPPHPPPPPHTHTRFDMSYIDSDGTKRQPIMIHRAIFGSLERFFGILVENYAGVCGGGLLEGVNTLSGFSRARQGEGYCQHPVGNYAGGDDTVCMVRVGCVCWGGGPRG